MEIANNFSGVIIGAIVALIGSYLANKRARHGTFNETVTKRRVDWLRLTADDVAKMLATAQILAGNLDKKCSWCDKCIRSEYDIKQKYYISRNHLLAHLPLNEPERVVLAKKIEELDGIVEGHSYDHINKVRDKILELSVEIEKNEWTHIKHEAFGKNR